MRIAYLVFAYNNPLLMTKSVSRLSCEDSSFFVHIDGKRDLAPFTHLRAPNVAFTQERITVYWAEFSGVEAILQLIREALAAPKPHDYFVLLSGSEYPIRSKEYIHAFLEAHAGQEFITMNRVPAPGKPLSRINTLRFPSTRPLSKVMFQGLAKLGLAERDYRKYLGAMEPYSGLTWWALSRDACQYIVEVVDRDHGLTRFFKNTFAPEESFFHTILGNSLFRSRARRNLLYEDWSAQGAHPEMINQEHLAYFESMDEVHVDDLHGPGELLFARKFSDKTLELTSHLDEMIRRKEQGRARPFVGQATNADGLDYVGRPNVGGRSHANSEQRL
jgi:hypothetical protein